MNTLNTAFIKLALFFIAGILAGFYIAINLSILLPVFAAVFLLFLLSYFWAKNRFSQDIFFGTSSFLLFFTMGILISQLHLPQNQSRHYINILSQKNSDEGSEQLLVSITEELKPDLYNDKFVAEVRTINEEPTHGKILLLNPRDSIAKRLSVGDLIIVDLRIQPIPAPLNPHQFNYRDFMANRNILGQISVSPGNYRILETNRSSLQFWANNWRAGIVERLRENSFDKEELGIIQALLLGQRQDISEEIYNSYAAAGAIHILAVSGLHVGIILLILHWLLSPLERLKKGRFLKTILLIVLLWLFALLAGLSPSVVRAVTMFSFVAIGLQIKRRTSVLNTLFMSLVVLLLIRPQFIFEVGFQLSYVAVFSIVLIQPALYKHYEPKNRFLKYMWALFTVTLAAQAGVLPLSLFYFHQFPGLFFVSNFVILPFMGLILAMGILVIILALLNFLPNFLTELYAFLISSLNRFVAIVARQESFLFQDVPFSGYQAIAFYFLLAALIFLLKKVSFRRISVALVSVVLVQLVFYAEKYAGNASEEFIVFHKSRNSIIGQKTGNHLIVDHNLHEPAQQSNLIRNYRIGENIKNLEQRELYHIYGIANEVLLVVDSSAIYKVGDLQPDYLLLINSPRLNLDRLLNELQPKAVIADGSNYKSLIQQWEETCKEKDIPFHATGNRGAFILPK